MMRSDSNEMKKIRTVFFLVATVSILLFSLPTSPHDSKRINLVGESHVQLPDGRWLIIGGRNSSGISDLAYIVDSVSGEEMKLPARMHQQRAWHSSTVLPDGTIFIFGGIGNDGLALSSAELFNPSTLQFEEISSAFTPRAYHTATLLTEGNVIIVGGSGNNYETLNIAELWNPETKIAKPIRGNLEVARMKHSAHLLPDGRIRFHGGITNKQQKIKDELYDSTSDLFSSDDTSSVDAQKTGSPHLMLSMPAEGEANVSTEIRIVLRFSEPLLNEGTNNHDLTLLGPNGSLPVNIVAAEQGMLLFVKPADQLLPNTTYRLILDNLKSQLRVSLPNTVISFSTTKSEKQKPDSQDSSVDNKSRSNWRELPPLKAPNGVTALSGQVLKLDGNPLHHVTITIENQSTQTDNTGRFLIESIPFGSSEMIVDGRTASNPQKKYGIFEVGLNIIAGQTNVLPYTIWMPLLDTEHEITIPSPTTSEIVLTTPKIPDLEVHIPAGTYIKDHEGNIVTKIGITPIPIDQPPFPLPNNVQVPVYFTIQPGGAYLYGSPGARIYYPNYNNHPPGKMFRFWHYEPEEVGWYVYGFGQVDQSGKQVIPDPGVAIYEFTGAMVDPPGLSPPPWDPGHCAEDGDPVDCATGLFIERKVDLYLPDVMPIVLERTHISRDTLSRPFGIGATHPYQIFLWNPNGGGYQEVDLILPDGDHIHYVRISPGTGYIDAVFEHTNSQTKFYKSQIVWNGNGWNLTLKDGTIYVFGDNAPLQSIRDRYGNQITLTRSGGQMGNITKITSPNQKFIAMTYDSLNRITQATDNLGRIVKYEYDSLGRLSKVTDPMGGITEYTYEQFFHKMLTIKNPRNNIYVTNEYDGNQRIFRQTRADSTTFQFTYVTDGNGKIVQTDITNPRGYVRRLTFNSAGYILTDTRAVGMSVQQTITNVWQTGTNLLLSVTDALGRKTSYAYDGMGNRISATRLDGTPQAVTTLFSYEPVFNLLNGITDPLNHTTTINYDSAGSPISIIDPLNNQISLTYNSSGQPITLTDPLNNATQFNYNAGYLTSATLPMNRIITQSVDIAGRIAARTNPLGQSTYYEFDSLNRTTLAIDSLFGLVRLAYDANSNLVSITDARNKQTIYSYDVMDRASTRTDPLQHMQTYLYDNNGNLSQITDRKNQITTYTYDPLDRLTQIQFHDGSTIAYTYDLGNRLTQIVDSTSGTTTLSYDDLNRLTGQVTSLGNVSYTYDNVDRRTTMTIAGQQTVNYSYDNADRLTQITQGSGTVILNYDAGGKRTSITLPNNTKMEYIYNAAAQVTEITYKKGVNVIGNLTYEYDFAGRITKIGGSFARTKQVSALNLATYNDANQQIVFGGSTLTYDNNGNLTSDGTRTYTWNARNQLTGISGPSLTATFQYDGLGRRRSKTINGNSTSFLYDGLNPVQELSGGNPNANLLTGLGIDEYFQRTNSSGSSYFFNDVLRSTIALTDASGNIQTEYTYEPYGKAITTGNPSSSSYKYAGREDDDPTGLFYYRSRFYHPGLQRFLGEDPIEFEGGLNLYSYVGNSPTNFVDPWGLLKLKFDISEGLLYVNPEDGRKIYSIPVTSGKPGCINDASCTDEPYGPIPPGGYEANLSKNNLSDRNWMGDILRNWGAGDWGDWRLRFDPLPGNIMPKGRTPGFYLHGGAKPGSAGCIDMGGGMFGNEVTEKIKEEILADPDGKIQLYVVK